MLEVLEHMDAYQSRQRHKLEVTAWQTAHIMNLWSKKRITVKKLLGSKSTEIDADNFTSLDSFVAAVEAAKRGN